LKYKLVSQGIATLFPGYFAMIMATGIISIAAYLLEMATIAWMLLVINVIAYGILWILTLTRLIWYFPQVLADLTNHSRAPGFFTLVAGTCVLGSQLIIVVGAYWLAIGLWLLGLFLWVLVMYAFFTKLTIRHGFTLSFTAMTS